MVALKSMELWQFAPTEVVAQCTFKKLNENMLFYIGVLFYMLCSIVYGLICNRKPRQVTEMASDGCYLLESAKVLQEET